MKKNLKRFFKGFSLVELMISLITISLISAAFAPIITKKLSSMGITVGSFGGNGGGGGGGSEEINCPSNITCEAGYYLDGTCRCQPCSDSNCTYCAHNVCSICNDGFTLINGKCENLACHESGGLPTQACCESIGAMFIDKKYTGTTDLCMMKYNAGDDENIYKVGTIDKIYHPKYPKIGVQINQAGVTTCTSSGNCCWKGKTSDGTNSYPGYSASNRTVCQQTAATKICSNWAFPGTVQGSWRLLTKAEAQKLAAAITAETSSAPVLSRYLGSDGLQLCDYASSSYGSNYCPPKSAVCTGAANSGYCKPHWVWIDSSGNGIQIRNGSDTIGTPDGGATSTASVRCVTSNVSEVVSAIDKETTSYNDVEPRNQQDCPEGTLFINKKYIGNGSNLCVMQYNATDDRYIIDGKIYNPPYTEFGVKVVDVGESCSTNSCCWKGTTSDGTNSNFNNNYSSSTRSVCQQAAAIKICSNWAYGNTKPGHWRLMTKNEATSLVAYLNVDGYYPGSESFAFFTKYLDSNGLQLCDANSSSYGSNSCPVKAVCSGAANSGGCKPYWVWIDSSGNGIHIGNGKATIGTPDGGATSTASVRCVSDNIRKKIEDTVETYQPNEPREQKDCDKYNALFIDKKFLNGASRNICMTKYNFADNDAADKGKPYIGSNETSDYSNIGVKIVSVSTSCSGGSCCWQGATSSGSGTYDYGPNNRTVCQQAAAKILCSYWAPDEISNKKWRLITNNEATGLASYITAETKYSSFLTKYLEDDGLQLCDYASSSYGSNYCPPKSAVCTGAANSGYCKPHWVWIDSSGNGIQIRNGKATIGTPDGGANSTASVRCVSDTVEWSD